MEEKVLEPEVVTAGYCETEFVDEQIQPVEETVEEQPKEEEKIDLIELAYNKLIEFQTQRYEAVTDEDRKKGRRLLRVPYDSLVFHSLDEFRDEMSRIENKTSRLSAKQRVALQELRNVVIWDMMRAKEESSKDDVAEDNDNVEG